MESLYIYIGHSSFGSYSISRLNKIPVDMTELNEFMYVKIPENFRIITLCNFMEKTTPKTTALLFGAIKSLSDFQQIINELFSYHNSVEKTEKILAFSRVLVSNFLIWSLGEKEISVQTLNSSLKFMFSDSIIQKIADSWKLFSSKEKLTKAWTTQGFITKLRKFDFITEEIIDLILNETKINISVYKSGDVMKFMNFDELSVFKNSDNVTIYNSGFHQVENYMVKKSPIHKILSKETFEGLKKAGESEESIKLRLAWEARSDISIEKKFPRFFNMNMIWEKFDSGTFIIPSCGTINAVFDKFFETNSIDKSQLDFFK